MAEDNSNQDDRLLSNKEDDDFLKELCSSNGITYGQLSKGGGESTTELEFFFTGFTRIIGTKVFPKPDPAERIQGLESCKKLSRMFLYGNNISKMENISHLKELETLWLARNNIINIEGLSELSKLKDLNVAGNKIEKIGHSLDSHNSLANLNLSGNNISTLKELTHLIRLPGLKVLGLKDPLYAPNPVCYLCNYSTHVLYHLPGLERLDSYDVCNKTMREMAEATVVKKKMYYNMRIQTLKRDQADMLQRLMKEKKACIRETKERIRKLTSAIKEVERELCQIYNVAFFEEAGDLPTLPRNDEGPGSGTESDTQNSNDQELPLNLKAKLARLKARLSLCYDKLTQMDQYHREATQRVEQSTELVNKRLMTELETGGNVRFEDGSSADVWFTSCHDLILSRFCVADYRVHGILGIKIHRITRVHNRMLRFRFESKLTKVTEDEDSPVMNKSPTVKKLQEYLFFVVDPALPGGENQLMSLLEEGPMDPQTYQQLGCDSAIPLSNSLSLCEKPRISHLINRAKKESWSDPCPFRHGHIVVCKVYLGKSLPVLDTKHRNSTTLRQIPSFVPSLPVCCPLRLCEKPPSPFVMMEEIKPGEKKPLPQPDPTIDDDILYMDPPQKPRVRYIALTQELILKTSKASNLAAITTLNLHGNGLSRLQHLSSLTGLQRLDVSFNELTKLDDIAHMQSLDYIDASFNKLCTLEGMKGLSKLKYLDLSWNDLTNTRDDLSILRKHMSNLTNLDLRHNNWQKPEA
ncbi:hypothetical protein BSL78_03891 [Apostichopus japonicus]|uniref:Leucine-rich repeat-containing protein 9 n=1 Tax=Stichopus japonicus TaxID=307972 RepID=A0A2G8LG14_STIJA|nr:hypothetical protein BSL78_03891 [Apostichopus japonicus]